MSYPGNPSLSAAVKDRVVSTFQQTLTLFQQGRTDDVAAGCNLLLQMDPLFDPARKLLEKLRNPAAPIDVSTLMPSATRDIRSPLEQAREAMADRDFQRVIQLTTDVLTEDMLNDEARILGDEAREKLEAAPFVEQFARKAELSLTSGNVASAKMELEKARALDPTHPEVVRVAQAISARDSAPVAAAVSPSFIVDDGTAPPQPGRSAAQAADFGFTFEEDKPATVSFDEFSFDAPAAASDFSFNAPAPAPKSDTPFGGFSFDATPSSPIAERSPAGGAEYDFSTASVLTSDDDQKKIEQYIADGDRAFQAGEYSQAIDLWSRIFLIDVTNDQASERIEAAKAKRRAIEQKVEPILAGAVDALERGDSAKARAGFTEVLAVDPRNSIALEYLERLADTSAEGATPGISNPYVPPSATRDADLFDEELPPGLEAPLIPPDPGAVRPAAPATAKSGKQKAVPAVKKAPRKLPVALIAIVVGVLALAGGGWFMWQQLMNGSEEVETAGEGEALIGRATMLAGQGKFDQAIKLLQDIKPGDPQHERALVMIADLRTKMSTSAQLVDGVPAEQHYAQRIAAAQAAFGIGDYSAAKVAFEDAMRVKPLPAELRTQYETAAQQASKLDAAKALFAERKYTEAIANLEPLAVQDPQNASIQRMIADAHFNLAAMAMQEDRLPDAIRELDEVLKVNPDDELARRTRELAQRYNGEPKDLLYKIYVKYLPLRQAT